MRGTGRSPSVPRMLSHRIPSDAAPNAWAQRLAELRAAGADLVDLTETNPTRTGLSAIGPHERAAIEAAHAGALELAYEPDPRGLRVAREAVARYCASRGMDVDPEHLVLTTGTSESYAHLFRLLADPGDTVLVPSPSYPLFEPLATLESVHVRSYALAYDGRWHLDLDSLERGLAAGAKAVLVVEPNHPTGTCLDERGRSVLEELCERYGSAIVSDEVFGDFGWDGRHGGLPSFAGRRRIPTFVLSGLSKVCGLPQHKLGWIWAGGPESARARALAGLEWIADLFLGVAGQVQHALPALLESRGAFQRRTLERIEMNRAGLAGAAARHPELTVLAAEGGWVQCIRLPATRSEEEWTIALLERGVIVHPGHFYDFAFSPVIVVSLIQTHEAFERGLERLESLLAES